MARQAKKKIPTVIGGYLYTNNSASNGIVVDSEQWFTWLCADNTTSFYYQGLYAGFTARRQIKRGGLPYWIAYRRMDGILRKVHLGFHVTRSTLEYALKRLSA